MGCILYEAMGCEITNPSETAICTLLNMDISISDPIGIIHDRKMGFLKQVLDPYDVQHLFEAHLISATSGLKSIQLRAIRVRRYKPERRCLIEYDVAVEGNYGRSETITLLGKIRAKGLNPASYQVLQFLWHNGFNDTSHDGISVAEPVGLIPEFQMWLQRKMPGVVATELLDSSQGVALASRIAEAARKLHLAKANVDHFHSIFSEMDILHERLARVVLLKPSWEKRINQLLDGCGRLSAAQRAPAARGIHRDFYSDQVLVHRDRLYLLDLDLYCLGDPALDIGNFIGHITEYSLRNMGDATGLSDREQALEDRYVELVGEASRQPVHVYTLLTLVRHIFLSTQFPERQGFTEALLELCEKRLQRERLAGQLAYDS